LQETAVDVLSFVMRFVIPVVIKTAIPLEVYEKSHHDIFELFMSIFASGNITDKSTKEMVMGAII